MNKLQTYFTYSHKSLSLQTTLQTCESGGGKELGHKEFQQVAAISFNESYSGQTLDKYRVANTIKNMSETEGYNGKVKNLQGTLDGIRGPNDSHDKKMEGDALGDTKTATTQYAKFFNTGVIDRNNNPDMTASNAAAINAFSVFGTDYTLYRVKELQKDVYLLEGALQWRGAVPKSGSIVNRYFKAFPAAKSVQISPKNFVNNTVTNLDECVDSCTPDKP